MSLKSVLVRLSCSAALCLVACGFAFNICIRRRPGGPTTGLRERGNDTSGSTGCSDRQNAATRRNVRREERVTLQGPVQEQQPDGMSHGGGGGHLSLFHVYYRC